MVIFAEFTHFVALNPAPHCNAYYAYTTLYEQSIAKFGPPENFAIENGTELIKNEIVSHFIILNIDIEHRMLMDKRTSRRHEPLSTRIPSLYNKRKR